MSLYKNIKRLALVTITAITVSPVMGQDLLARQAPVDRKATAVDTIALHMLIEREMANSPAGQLYNEWSNQYAHRESALPDSFRIDLRRFHMPTQSRVITSQYGRRWGRMHKGLDIKVYIGDTIRAAFDGKVRVVRYESSGYGNFVVIRHNNGLETIYGHMSKQLVREDEQVRAGDPIGLGGNTGRSTGSHLHFETRLCGVALNPALMFDFRNQDVTGDYYMFRKNRHTQESQIANRTTGRKQDSYTQEEVTGEATPQLPEVTEAVEAPAKKQQNHITRRDAQFHKVKKGETLYSIAHKRGISVDKLCKINKIGKNKSIRPGQILKFS
ncbi:MAG: peptidoglycan DD-metalloendopeptidase family protein [Prevotella sp.]|nr:peptidoglycan DD-metalloendopeptidase family protein [Prevotella sp.]